MASTPFPVLDESHQAMRSVIAGVGAAGWAAPTPCEQWNAGQVLRHAAGDQLAFAAAITGSGGPAENPFEPSAASPDDPADYLEAALLGAVAAWSTVTPGTASLPTPLPQGAMAADDAAAAAALDMAVHAWDIAAATGQPDPLPAELAARLMPVALAIVEPLRAYGVYAAALSPEPGDDAAAALLRYLGRPPAWSG
ncbi:MAG TPA: TIGR03086 family metal-binding protein, partial [Streptosporangiaceae bacterium]|jgi:uncharacterized protein (TIGR03086 family)